MSSSESFEDEPSGRRGVVKPSVVPKFATPLPPSRPTGGPLSPLSPLSPTGKALGAFNLQASELKGVDTNSSGEVEIDGIPEESWDIAYRDLEIERELAEGTFGRVYLGTYFGTSCILFRVAIKLLFQADMVANIGKYILRELAMLRAITHPNVVQFLGLCRNGGDVFVVTEYLENGDLMEVLHNRNLAPISWSLRVHLCMEITKPVAFLHNKNIVHRDLKLENVLVGSNWSIKLCDFGFARCMDNVETRGPHSRMRKMTVAGTDQWMAPEVLMQQAYNTQADIFSLGCTFYEILCRKQPPSRVIGNKYALDVQEFLQNVEKNTPKDMVVLVLDMCQQQPSKRPTAAEVLARLKAVAEKLPPVDLAEAAINLNSLHAPPQPEEGNKLKTGKEVGSSLHEGEEESGDYGSEGENYNGEADAGANLLSLQLRRAMSAESGSQLSSSPVLTGQATVGGSRILESMLSSRLRFDSLPLQTANTLSTLSCFVTVTSSYKPRPQKLFAVLTTEGTIYIYKNEKSSESSIFRILMEQQSVVSRTERVEVLRVSTPVSPGVFWLFDFKAEEMARKWYNALLSAIMRSDLDYHGRLKAGSQFGWSPASRDPRTRCFPCALLSPTAIPSVILAVSAETVRVFRPFTEEILSEWDFGQLASYQLSAGGLVQISVAFPVVGGRFGKLRETIAHFSFESPLHHRDIYNCFEEAFAENKRRNDAMFQEMMSGGSAGVESPKSSGGAALGTGVRRDKGKRMTINLGTLGRPVSEKLPSLAPIPEEDEEVVTTAKREDRPVQPINADLRRGRSSTFNSLFRKKSSGAI